MNVNSELKKYGIEIIKPLETMRVNSIAKNIATKLCEKFKEFNLDYNDLFSKIARLKMYVAKIPKSMAEANYFYKDDSIYFSENINYEDIDIFALHECLHYLQQIKDKNNKLVRLGLCEFFDFSIYGMGLNEGAVQYIASLLKNSCIETVKYFNIHFSTNSPTYYPLLCNLIGQMTYLTGVENLANSVLFANDIFKEKFIELTNETTYLKVCKNLDTILKTEEELINLKSKLENLNSNINTINKINAKINSKRDKITNIFLKTQNIIFTTYFDYEFQKISTEKEIEMFRNKLYNYKNLIGTNDEYNYYNTYYIEKMAKLEDLYNLFRFETSNNNLALVKSKTNIIINLFKKLKGFIKAWGTN